MANIKSQMKRIKTNEKARMRNKAVRSELHTATRKLRALVEAGDTAAATEQSFPASWTRLCPRAFCTATTQLIRSPAWQRP